MAKKLPLQNMNPKNLPKRKLAQLFRRAAATIEEYGWITGALGTRERGFCFVGGLDDAARELGIAYRPRNCSPDTARKLGISERVVRSCSMNTTPAMDAAGNYLMNDDGTYKYVAAGFSFIDFNDEKARSQEDVTGFLRRLARHLEHGGSL